jgi:hypothetical protein
MYFFSFGGGSGPIGGGGSGVRIPDVPFDITNIFSFILWVVMTFAPIGELLINIIFTTWKDLAGNTYSLSAIILNPVTLGTIWFAHALRALTQ